jgi:transposase
LARRTTKTSVEIERGRLATKRHRSSIGRKLGSGEPTFVKRGREGGEEALKAHPPQGVSPRLTAEQKAQIPTLLAKGAQAYGFRGDVGTASRVDEVIKRIFGVRSNRDHVGKLMREIAPVS